MTKKYVFPVQILNRLKRSHRKQMITLYIRIAAGSVITITSRIDLASCQPIRMCISATERAPERLVLLIVGLDLPEEIVADMTHSFTQI